MDGTGNNFNPDGIITRGRMVIMLYRMEGEPAAAASSFSDVSAGQDYTNAVAWASANSIVEGVGNNRFEPGNEIRWEDAVTILYRYAKYKGYDVTAAGDLSVYPDSGKVSSYAKDAMTWAVGAKLINDIDGKLIPGDFTNRAQMAQLLMNFCEKVA